MWKTLAWFVFAVVVVGAFADSSKQPATSQSDTASNEKPKNPAKWQTVPYPDNDGTRMGYDANSIVFTKDGTGNLNGVDITARVVGGDASINGQYLVLSFDCAGNYRINHSYPLPFSPGLTQALYIGDIACAAARSEMRQRQALQ